MHSQKGCLRADSWSWTHGGLIMLSLLSWSCRRSCRMLVFRPSLAVSQDDLVESRACHHRFGHRRCRGHPTSPGPPYTVTCTVYCTAEQPHVLLASLLTQPSGLRPRRFLGPEGSRQPMQWWAGLCDEPHSVRTWVQKSSVSTLTLVLVFSATFRGGRHRELDAVCVACAGRWRNTRTPDQTVHNTAGLRLLEWQLSGRDWGQRIHSCGIGLPYVFVLKCTWHVFLLNFAQ